MGKSRVWLMIAFGLLPPVSLAFLYKMLLYNTPIAIHVYLLRILGILVIGFILLSLYSFLREPFEKKNPKLGTLVLLAGAGGVLLVLLYCFLFIDLLALLIFPEKWWFIKLPIPYPLFSITPLIQFAGFLLLSLVITGAAILFFYYKWPEKRLSEDTPHYTFLKYHGYGLLLAGALLLPLFIFWDLATLPGYSLSMIVFILAGLTAAVLSFLGWAAVSMIRHTKKNPQALPRHSVPVFLLALLLFGLVIGKNHALRANASRETITVLVSDAQKTRNEIISQREEIYAKNMVIDEKLGEQIYNERCTACHLFDKKIIGPPFNSVLPKYINKKDELAAFIKNPVKVDPAYPAMPNPGLTTIQIKSVVKFLMIKMGEKTE
jgi:cytochrome c